MRLYARRFRAGPRNTSPAPPEKTAAGLIVVIADTTHLNYLVLINAIEILPQLYGRVLIPAAVVEELKNPEAPAAVRTWIVNPPGWLDVRTVDAGDPALAKANLGASAKPSFSLWP